MDYMHGHEPGASPDRIRILEHNLSVVMQRLDDQSAVLDAIVLAMMSLENRLERVESRLVTVERATPWKAPKPPPNPPRRP
jgi:hypothetical protein